MRMAGLTTHLDSLAASWLRMRSGRVAISAVGSLWDVWIFGKVGVSSSKHKIDALAVEEEVRMGHEILVGHIPRLICTASVPNLAVGLR